MAMMISRIARVNYSHPYLENDPASSLVSHRLRISPWLRFRHSGSIAGKSVISANAANSLVDRFPKALWGFSSL